MKCDNSKVSGEIHLRCSNAQEVAHRRVPLKMPVHETPGRCKPDPYRDALCRHEHRGRTSGSFLLPSLFAGYKARGLLKSPERIARLAVFLASEESNIITGEPGTEKHYMSLGYKE